MHWFFFLLCLIWLGMGLAIIVNVRAARKLAELPLAERAAWPRLAIVAPASNEGRALESAMHKRMASDYPALEVVVVDDRSTDDTGDIADRLAREDPRIRVIHNHELPEGWLGKLHALKLGIEATDAEWLLFSDADVEIAPGTLRRAVHHCLAEGWDVLAAMPTMKPAGLLVGAMHSVFLRVLFAAYRVKATEDPRSSYGMGVGAFTLVKRSAYLASPGFKAIKLEIADDLMLGRLLKRSGARCTAVNGAGAAAVDIYPTVRDFVRGAEKNAWGVSAGFSLVRGLLFTGLFLALDASPFLLAATAPTSPWQLVGVVAIVWALGISMLTLRANGRRPWLGLLFPLGTLLFLWAMVRGILLGWWRGGLQWRDTFYPTSVFLAARRR